MGAIEFAQQTGVVPNSLSRAWLGRSPWGMVRASSGKALAAATDAAQALDAIQTDTDRARRLDFHSLRRSYNTARRRGREHGSDTVRVQ